MNGIQVARRFRELQQTSPFDAMLRLRPRYRQGLESETDDFVTSVLFCRMPPDPRVERRVAGTRTHTLRRLDLHWITSVASSRNREIS